MKWPERQQWGRTVKRLSKFIVEKPSLSFTTRKRTFARERSVPIAAGRQSNMDGGNAVVPVSSFDIGMPFERLVSGSGPTTQR